VEGVSVVPKERELPLEHRVDRSHRRRVSRRRRRHRLPWTRGEKAVLVLGLVLVVAEAILVVVPFLL
jgi:hypothetical protein